MSFFKKGIITLSNSISVEQKVKKMGGREEESLLPILELLLPVPLQAKEATQGLLSISSHVSRDFPGTLNQSNNINIKNVINAKKQNKTPAAFCYLLPLLSSHLLSCCKLFFTFSPLCSLTCVMQSHTSHCAHFL